MSRPVRLGADTPLDCDTRSLGVLQLKGAEIRSVIYRADERVSQLVPGEAPFDIDVISVFPPAA
jgi:hypothetical protein